MKCDSTDLQKHDVPIKVSAAGCSEDAARSALVNILITQAEKERKEKCAGLDCDAGGVCATCINPDDWETLKKRVKIVPIRREGCPDGVGYLALLSNDKPDTPNKDQYTSACICTPKPTTAPVRPK
jgi:hypothetical protein